MASEPAAAAAVPEERLPPPLRALDRLDRALGRVEELVLAGCLTVLIGLGAYQAIVRNVFRSNPYWIDEVIRYSMFLLGLIGGALATQSNRLINGDVFSRLLPPRGRLVASLVTTLFTLYVCWLLVGGGMRLERSVADEQGEVLPVSFAALGLPVAVVLIGTHLILHAVIDLWRLVAGHLPPENSGAPTP